MTLIRKLHTYAGLLTFINLVVFGIAGLTATLEWRKERAGSAFSQERAFTPRPNSTDRQVAEQVVALIGLSLATPVQNAAIQHDAANNLFLDFWTVNGRQAVTVLEKEGKIRIVDMRNRIWDYLDALHTTTGIFRAGDWRMWLWACYNEFAMWCLAFMIASGVALWLMSRPRHRLAQISLGMGCAMFTVLYIWTR
jgi:hypothetical protein